MGVLKAEPARAQDWAAKSVGAAWRAFDWQMTIFAILLIGFGQAMAYSNTVAAGDGLFEPAHLRGVASSGPGSRRSPS